MTRPGHQEPLFDNRNPANMEPHAEEEQLRIGQAPLEQAAEDDDSLGLPPHLQLTDKERLRYNNLVDTFGSRRAIIQAVSREKGRQIVGFWESQRIHSQLSDSLAESQARAAEPVGPTAEELLELFRDVYEKPKDDTSSKAA